MQVYKGLPLFELKTSAGIWRDFDSAEKAIDSAIFYASMSHGASVQCANSGVVLVVNAGSDRDKMIEALEDSWELTWGGQ